MTHPSNVIPLFTKTHRVVPPMRGEDMARAARDPDAVYVRGVRREIGEFDKVLKRQRNQPHNRLLIIAFLAAVPWLCLGVVVVS